MLPNGWQQCSSTAVEAFRFLPDRGALQIVFDHGRMVYDYPCSEALFGQFVRAPSKGRFVNEILKPHARRNGWAGQPYRWTSW